MKKSLSFNVMLRDFKYIDALLIKWPAKLVCTYYAGLFNTRSTQILHNTGISVKKSGNCVSGSPS